MKRLGRSHVWLLNLAVPAAVVAVNACSSPAAAPPSGGTGGSVSGNTGGTSFSTGGTTTTGTGGTATTGTTGGTTATGTGGTTTGTTGGTTTGTTGGTTTSGTTGGTTTGTTGGTTTTGTTGGATTTATGGSGGAAPKVKMCATKTTLTVPLMTNFDSYDGKTAAEMWTFPFNGKTGADADAPYAGPYTYNDMTGTPFIGMVGGANASTYAISVSNPMATGWGGALAFWMACVNASTYTGISFYARGSIPTGKVSVSLTMEPSSKPEVTDPKGGGTCDAGDMCKSPMVEVPVTADWTLIKIPWSMFAAGVGSGMAVVTANGDKIAGFAFQAGLTYAETAPGSMTYAAVPGMYSFELDDLGFY
jgi:hypothetical protein